MSIFCAFPVLLLRNFRMSFFFPRQLASLHGYGPFCYQSLRSRCRFRFVTFPSIFVWIACCLPSTISTAIAVVSGGGGSLQFRHSFRQLGARICVFYIYTRSFPSSGKDLVRCSCHILCSNHIPTDFLLYRVHCFFANNTYNWEQCVCSERI